MENDLKNKDNYLSLPRMSSANMQIFAYNAAFGEALQALCQNMGTHSNSNQYNTC